MSSARPPMHPPELPGFEHVRLLGSGGYSDVFLYEQQMPRRQVAIKVLLAEARDNEGRQAFFDEANAMASVSTHPFIVSVFHAEVSAEGHPYLVMEYYPRDNFSVRARNEQIPVFEALRVGIQVASAVETAHRAGILHRDIKPANILTSEYDRPGLTDFGIATASGGGIQAEGMSIPWSPPEVVNGSAPGDVTADVYSLAGTVHTLLSGRSPFEVPGGSNRTFDLIPRIEAGGVQPTGRADVPESLERVLRHGMSRAAADRPGSAAEFARLLQQVEVELGLTPTQLEIRQDPRDVKARSAADDDDGTRLKGPRVIQSQGDTGGGPGQMVTGAPSVPEAGAVTGYAGPHQSLDPGEGTLQRGVAQPSVAPGMISGVGARPVGLAGSPGPRPVKPMPSAAQQDRRTFDPADHGAGTGIGNAPVVDTADTGRHGIEKRNWVKLAAGLVVGALVLAGVGAVFAATGGEACEAGEDGCPTTTGSSEPPPPPPTDDVPDPAGVGDLVVLADGRKKIRWIHEVSDVASIDYEIRGPNGRVVVGEVAGSEADMEPPSEVAELGDDVTVLSASVATDLDCLTVWAHERGGTKWGQSDVVC